VITRGQVFLLYGKDRAGFNLDIAYGALAPGDVGEFGVVSSGHYADNTQALIRIDAAVLVVLALVRAPIRCASGG
jgi:hypothetical protein